MFVTIEVRNRTVVLAKTNSIDSLKTNEDILLPTYTGEGRTSWIRIANISPEVDKKFRPTHETWATKKKTDREQTVYLTIQAKTFTLGKIPGTIQVGESKFIIFVV